MQTFKTIHHVTNFQNVQNKLGSKTSLFVCLFLCKACGRHTANPPEKLRTHTSGVQYWGDCVAPGPNVLGTAAIDLEYMNVILKWCMFINLEIV